MAVAIRGRVDGLDALLKHLDSLGKKVRRKVLRSAVSKAAKQLKWEARGRVREASGLLKRSLGEKVKAYRQSGVVTGIVGPRTGFKQSVQRGSREVEANPTRYAHLVERGTKRSKAYPFLAEAFKARQAQLKETMARIISEGIESAAQGR